MGKTRRKYSHECIIFRKQFKKPLDNIASIMPIGFSDELFYSEFERNYTYLWEDICNKYKEYKRMDEGLFCKGYSKRYFFPTPETFLKHIAIHRIKAIRDYHNIGNCLSKEEQDKIKQRLILECKAKVTKRESKKENNLLLTQLVRPEYVNYFITSYFDSKRHNPLDVNKRYAILKEVSLYKCPETIKFLCKVNASERNYTLRHYAFTVLQKFNVPEIRLRKNRKGKKKQGDIEIPNEIASPEALLQYIYNSQLEKMKSFDLFLSHSSVDKEELIKLKVLLNSNNINIYVDWVNDKESLKRELTNIDTAQVIIERLKASKCLLYVHTKASLFSKWTAWELGYFHALGRKICVYTPDDTIERPPYLDIYSKVLLKNDKLIVIEDGEKIAISDWIEK